MINKKSDPRQGHQQLTAADVGRYLKRLSTIHKDTQTGNRALSDALQEISAFLISSNAKTVENALIWPKQQVEMGFSAEPKFNVQDISLEEVSRFLDREAVTRADLANLGVKRFGIPESKINKMSKESAIKTIRAALEHEKSIEILSDEARKGGQARTS